LLARGVKRHRIGADATGMGEDPQARDCWHQFDVAVARWQLGEIRAEDLPAAALDALTKGGDSPSLARLAGMDWAGWSQVENELKRVLAERGVQLPDRNASLKVLSDDVLSQMTTGECVPEEGTNRLFRLATVASKSPAFADLATFWHLERDWEVADYAGFDRGWLRSEMVRAAQELLARGGVQAS
jgi:hypothetical protein